MKNRIGPTVKHVWKVAMHVWHNLFWVCHKHNSLPSGPIQPSSLSTKKLHAYCQTYLECSFCRGRLNQGPILKRNLDAHSMATKLTIKRLKPGKSYWSGRSPCLKARSEVRGIERFLTPCIVWMRKKLDYPTAFYTAHLNEPLPKFPDAIIWWQFAFQPLPWNSIRGT